MSNEGSELSHVDASGAAHMVDISAKNVTQRRALAEGFVHMAPATLAAVQSNTIAKGEVLAVARVAGIQGAKRCSDLIPLCHPLPLSKVSVDFNFEPEGIRVRADCRTQGRTGVEMEAMTAVSVAALTIYDMCKAVQKDITIGGVRLLEKTGGKSGAWTR